MNYIEELKDVIRKLHGVEATHVQSVPVKETFQGETVWDGIVEVFELHGHPKAKTAYAWTPASASPTQPRRSVTVLHLDPITSPVLAVRAAIVQELRNLGNPEEA